MRIFIAIAPPKKIREQSNAVVERLKKDNLRARWVTPENRHVTLAYLGEISDSAAHAVCSAVGRPAEQHPPFTLYARGLGVFPTIKKARVLWIGIGGDTDQLFALQNNISSVLTNMDELQYHSAHHRFQAHITLGRFRHPPAPELLMNAFSSENAFRTDKFSVTSVHIYQSILTPDGAVHRVVDEVRLGNDTGSECQMNPA